MKLREMTDPFAEDWVREIEEFSKFCAPAALAAVLGISRGEAADRLLEVGVIAGGDSRKWDGKWSSMVAVAKVLGRPLEKQSVNYVYGSGRVKFTDRFLTVNQWLAENRESVAVIRASNHFLYVGFGQVLEDNGVKVRKGRVTHAVFLEIGR